MQTATGAGRVPGALFPRGLRTDAHAGPNALTSVLRVRQPPVFEQPGGFGVALRTLVSFLALSVAGYLCTVVDGRAVAGRAVPEGAGIAHGGMAVDSGRAGGTQAGARSRRGHPAPGGRGRFRTGASRPALRSAGRDVAGFCRERVRSGWASGEGSDSSRPEALSVTVPSHGPERRFARIGPAGAAVGARRTVPGQGLVQRQFGGKARPKWVRRTSGPSAGGTAVARSSPPSCTVRVSAVSVR